MELNRRGFLGRLAALGATLSASGARVAAKVSPRRVAEAVRARWYPGPVHRLDRKAAREPGSKWGG